VDVIAGLHADDADVFHSRLGAVARAAGDRKLHLRRRPRAAQEALEFDAKASRILNAEPAPLAADAGLHGAEAFSVGCAGDEAGGVELRPRRGKIGFPEAKQVDALAAGHLHGFNV
jgi:hypothetical protein